ncbi:MAG TPA: phosphonate ABC transporter, permease protein PhnE [Candidatus Lachnoclostridium pullistercoris]|uniref:Phosphonate ABC transporter, permease protein PhnE n=1 Tax=Candidatus Lachnoclostridium pullistercoris TaxID=2838632 RepID=A0A9D2T721_9FIRM|nr:phosphonate ABC transporter, permease protein PhnE [Candidatus Lachnoclostridium pullistercoris]
MKNRTITLSNGKTVEQPRSHKLAVCILLLAALALSVRVTGFQMSVLIRGGYRFFDILKQMVPPDIDYLDHVWGPLFDTIKMSILGSAAGAVLAVPFSVLASSNIVKNRGIIGAVRIFYSIVRTLPTLVTALIATYIFGLGTFAGTIAIGVFTFSYVGKLLYEQIETVDMGAYEAMEALGADRFHAFLYSVVPQILPGYISNCLFCFEGNVRYAAILGYVGAGGLGLIINEKVGWREYDKVGMILVTLFGAVVIIEFISHQIRKRLT